MPYLPIQHPLVPLLMHSQLNIRRIRAGHLWLRHQKGAPDLALQQRLQPSILLLLRAILRKDLHIPRIGRRTVRRFRRRPALAQTLRHQPVLQIAEAGTLFEVVFGQEHVPETQLLCALLEVFNNRRVGAEALGGRLADLLGVDGVCGDAFFFDKFFDLLWIVLLDNDCSMLGNFTKEDPFWYDIFGTKRNLETYNIQRLLRSITHERSRNDRYPLGSRRLSTGADHEFFRYVFLCSRHAAVFLGSN
jgi:hypothetical protein